MAKQDSNSAWSLKKLIFWAISIALFSLLIVIILEKLHVIDLYKKPVPVVIQSNGSKETKVNSVDFSPATEAEKPTNDQKKQDTTGSTTQNPAQAISITLSAAAQDVTGGPVIIRTILENTTAGNCVITLSKDANVKTYNSKITWQGNYYSCNYDVPYADLTNGNWQLKIIATQDTKQGTASAVVKVN
jgi:hypothetical protein